MEPDYNLIGTGIDLRQVDPISQKRLLAFFNFWLLQTVKFMNDCASQFESKLLDVDNRLRQLEASMTLLEAKLASIPGLDGDQFAPKSSSVPVQKDDMNGTDQKNPPKEPSASAMKPDTITTPNPTIPNASANATEPAVPDEPKEDISKDPRYAKYFKMLQLGVPENAVKQKMDLEGVDSSILQQAGSRGSQSTTQSSVPKSKTKGDDSDSFDDSEESSFSD